MKTMTNLEVINGGGISGCNSFDMALISSIQHLYPHLTVYELAELVCGEEAYRF